MPCKAHSGHVCQTVWPFSPSAGNLGDLGDLGDLGEVQISAENGFECLLCVPSPLSF